jgi:predicted DNA-binding protein
MATITIEVDKDTERRLSELSAGGGVTISQFVREVLDSYLEDAEDIAGAEAALREAERDGFIPWEEVKATHGL